MSSASRALAALGAAGVLLACGAAIPEPEAAPAPERPAPAPAVPVAAPPSPPAPAPTPEAVARALVDALARGDAVGATERFDPAMRSALTPAALEATWQSLITRAGGFEAIERVEHQEKDGHDVVVLGCRFARAAVDARVVLDGELRVAGLFFGRPIPPAAPAPRYAHLKTIEERALVIGTEPWRLPATATVPLRPKGKLPAVVLVHGSGPNDRDETVGACKPFRDLALGLGTRGAVVVRYDKRTLVHGAALARAVGEALTVREETLDDVAVAVAAARALPEVDPARVFVVGHSLGGTVMPRIAAADASLRGFVVMAGSTRPLEDLVVEQLEYIALLDGGVSEAEAQVLKQVREQAARVKALRPGAPAPPASELPLGLAAPYWLDLVAHPPAQLARRDRRPILVLHGDRDYQVSIADFEGWRRGLAGHPRAKLKRYPALNHLFVAGTGKSSPVEYDVPGNVDVEVVDDIAAFIGAR
jgi:fermentation-respiration switch protein FrsA (DUF1100 family)